ncbi:MAG: flagellar biosynthetic protein FliO [Parvularculaceae bacterium]|nr:flagellar biosynthetic protein FliO [Parvularculaceae bacterium]
MELIDLARIVFSLIAVIGMIGVAAIAAKKFGLQNGALAGNRARRLALVESLPIDQRRRIAIISCDGREHLVILDQSRVTLIERAIPARETALASDADPFARMADAPEPRKLHVPARVAGFLQRTPRDRAPAFRAAGIL